MSRDVHRGAIALVLADAALRGESAEIRRLFDRIGLLSDQDNKAAEIINLAFSGTAMCLRVGGTDPIASACGPTAAPCQSIGGASAAAPDPAGLLRLSLAMPHSDQFRYVQQVQRLCAAAAMIGSACGAGRLYWPPASLWSPLPALIDAVAASERQGLPPVMHLIAFANDDVAIVTRGLTHFCDVEFQLRSDSPMAMPEMVRRLARLCIHAMLVGPTDAGAELPGLSPGETIRVGPRKVGTYGDVVDHVVLQAS